MSWEHSWEPRLGLTGGQVYLHAYLCHVLVVFIAEGGNKVNHIGYPGDC